MADYLQNEAGIWVSKEREGTFNTPPTAGSAYLAATADDPQVVLPEVEKSGDKGRAGITAEFGSTLCNGYVVPPTVTLASQANFDLAGRLAMRAVGGVPLTPAVVVASTAWRHVAHMLPKSAGRQLPSSAIISELGGASFLLPGMVIEQFRLEQEGVNIPAAKFGFIGSGKHRTAHGITSLPAAPAFSCVRPKSYMSYTDDVGLKDLAAACRMKGWFFELTNNHAPAKDRCSGDPTQDLGNYATSGSSSEVSYNAKLNRGTRVITAEARVLLDATLEEWLKAGQNIPLTDVTFGARGAVLDATGPTYYSLKVIIPNARFAYVRNVAIDDQAGVALGFEAMYDATSVAARVEVVNNISANYN